MSIYIVYKATNRVNGKNYIGYTNNLEQRKRRHLSSSNNKNDKGYFSHFHCAIRLYGWNNFIWTIIFQTTDLDVIKKAEIFYIWLYKSFSDRSKGYNLTIGGDGCSGTKHTEEQNAVQSSRQKECIPWNKGITGYKINITEENRKIMSERFKIISDKLAVEKKQKLINEEINYNENIRLCILCNKSITFKQIKNNPYIQCCSNRCSQLKFPRKCKNINNSLKYDHNEYKFSHKEYGIVVTKIKNLCDTYKLSYGKIKQLTKNIQGRNTHKGWTIIS